MLIFVEALPGNEEIQTCIYESVRRKTLYERIAEVHERV